jgi:hypothetical protein
MIISKLLSSRFFNLIYFGLYRVVIMTLVDMVIFDVSFVIVFNDLLIINAISRRIKENANNKKDINNLIYV